MKNKMLGCIIGGACGDALGYPVEFMTKTQIDIQFGPEGIIGYPFGEGLISDDTQMTLFTIDGLLKCNDGKYPFQELDYFKRNIYESYQDWFITQTMRFRERSNYLNYDEESRLLNIENLFDLRAPGNTCLSSLKTGIMGSVDKPINDSMGCGGVMRVAPVGLFLSPKHYTPAFVGVLGAEVAATTHGHAMGYVPAAMMALLINKLCYSDIKLEDAVVESLEETEKLFGNHEKIKKFSENIRLAINLSKNNDKDIINIPKLGAGWVGDEALYIAIYSVLRHVNSFEDAIICAVNHSGDSDSTGSIAGNIIGCYLGYDSIPEKFLDDLELKDLITEMVDDIIKSQ
jgi:ADP-ribosylglycohydrolase